MTKRNGFHVGLKFKNNYVDLYSVSWLKNGKSIAIIDFVDGKITRAEKLKRLKPSFLKRLETIARGRKE